MNRAIRDDGSVEEFPDNEVFKNCTFAHEQGIAFGEFGRHVFPLSNAEYVRAAGFPDDQGTSSTDYSLKLSTSGASDDTPPGFPMPSESIIVKR